jgi:hypothetical protein
MRQNEVLDDLQRNENGKGLSITKTLQNVPSAKVLATTKGLVLEMW